MGHVRSPAVAAHFLNQRVHVLPVQVGRFPENPLHLVILALFGVPLVLSGSQLFHLEQFLHPKKLHLGQLLQPFPSFFQSWS
jgi:hypothetical protein